MCDPQRILIVLPNPVGDAVMATPSLRAVRERFATSWITFLGRSGALETLRGAALSDDDIEDVSARFPSCWNTARLIRRIRGERFDLAILLPNSFRSALLAWGGGARKIVGYARGARGWMLTDKLAPPRDSEGAFAPVPQIDYYLAIASHAGGESDGRRMTLAETDADSDAAGALMAECSIRSGRPVILLNPGAGFGPSKIWPPERFAAVADALIETRSAQIIINAAPNERTIAARVAEAMKNPPAINFAEREGSLGLLKGMMSRCSLLITNDTGARHFAAAFDVPVVTLFGSTDPTWAQIDFAGERAIRVDVPCSPCQKPTCRIRGEGHHRCMKAITPEMVLAAAYELLDADWPKGDE